MPIFRRLHPVTAPHVITIKTVAAYTEDELRAACQVAIRLRCVLYLCAPRRS